MTKETKKTDDRTDSQIGDSKKKQNRESTKGYSRWKVEKRHGNLEELGLNNWSISKSQNGGRNQVSGRVSVPCWLATPVANAPWKTIYNRLI